MRYYNHAMCADRAKRKKQILLMVLAAIALSYLLYLFSELSYHQFFMQLDDGVIAGNVWIFITWSTFFFFTIDCIAYNETHLQTKRYFLGIWAETWAFANIARIEYAPQTRVYTLTTKYGDVLYIDANRYPPEDFAKFEALLPTICPITITESVKINRDNFGLLFIMLAMYELVFSIADKIIWEQW